MRTRSRAPNTLASTAARASRLRSWSASDFWNASEERNASCSTPSSSATGRARSSAAASDGPHLAHLRQHLALPEAGQLRAVEVVDRGRAGRRRCGRRGRRLRAARLLGRGRGLAAPGPRRAVRRRPAARRPAGGRTRRCGAAVGGRRRCGAAGDSGTSGSGGVSGSGGRGRRDRDRGRRDVAATPARRRAAAGRRASARWPAASGAPAGAPAAGRGSPPSRSSLCTATSPSANATSVRSSNASAWRARSARASAVTGAVRGGSPSWRVEEHEAHVLGQVAEQLAEVLAALHELVDGHEQAGRVARGHEVGDPHQRRGVDHAEDRAGVVERHPAVARGRELVEHGDGVAGRAAAGARDEVERGVLDLDRPRRSRCGAAPCRARRGRGA